MAPAPGVLAPRRAVRRVALAVAVAGALTLSALPVRGAALLVSLGLTVGVTVEVRRRAARAGHEATVWRWFSRASGVLAAGIAAELGIAVVALLATGQGRADGGVGPPAGVAVGVGAMLACPALYQGLVQWNRYRTRVSDPADWLNGLAGVWGLVAIGLAAFAGSTWPVAQRPAWELVLWLFQGAALIVLAGTAFTIISLGGLARDARSWTVAGALAVGAVIQVLVALTARGSAAEVAVTSARAAAVSWTVAVTGILVASSLGVRRVAARQASSQSTTGGALVVLVAATVLLARNAVVADASLRLSTVVAAAAAAIAMFRLLLLVRELAQLALSRWEARTDDLTGVPNRRHLMEVLAALGPTRASLVLVDLERFKEVNDTFGHAAGDQVIRVAATRLQDCAAGRGTLARLGGDEFALVLPGASLMGAESVARELAEHLAEPLEVRGGVVRIGASIGVAVMSDGDDEDLMRRADAAMYRAKREGGGVRLYDEAADTAARAERRLLADLRALLADDPARDHGGSTQDVGELVVHYQPMLDAGTRVPVGVEALVRWSHPVRGLLPPPAFLDLAERHGLMGSVTARVLDQAVGEVASWRGPGADVRLSVNLSGSCLESTALVDVVASTLDRHGLPANRLVLEITETTVVLDDAGAIAVAEGLAGLGVTLSIDDYGTGYSSLARVLAFPAEELKLDRSFTLRLTSDDRTAALVAGTIEFAHRLGLRVVAEGVEDEATFDAVAELGCDITQGYLHARPLAAEAVRAWFVGVPCPQGGGHGSRRRRPGAVPGR